MMARVRGVIAAATDSGSMVRVSASTSAKIGTAPTSATADAVAMKVNAGTMTSSPMPILRVRRMSCSETVPLATAMPWRASW